MKKLPVGIQTFKDIRDKDANYLYIDKTDIAYKLITSGKYYFLSRPRRFGKSLFMDTVQNIFEANKELFEGLAIYDKWDWDTKYPVIKIAFGKARNPEDLQKMMLSTLKDNQHRLGVVCDSLDDYAICFKELIQKVYQAYNQKVVILIDEYDKPILDNLDQLDIAKEHREILSRFYTEIKNADEYIKFTMLTGVSKFSKASIFSGLNMLEDISLNPDFGNICGYTQKDIETTFLPYLKDQDFKKIKTWYNGYNFLKDELYNPFDILLFIKNNYLFDNYWFSTGTPTFLIKLIKANNYFMPNLSNLVVGKKLLDSFDIENLDLEVILYQSGYLTIEKMIQTKRGRIEYKLKLPNEEVKSSFSDILIDFLTSQKTQKLRYQDNIYDALIEANLELLEQSLKSIFASIPYNNYVNNTISSYEGYYASVFYAYLQSLGFEIIGEDVTNKGRIDLTLFIDDKVYIFEFKVIKDLECIDEGLENSALKQIKEKNYHQKYIDSTSQIYLVGIEFDKDEKNICSFAWEKVKDSV